ncbi:tyrosine-type recombinase/integrase [Dokdonella sp. MW10]|uniref:tyrosine-type recombinase/integrase n=1 Tax=Dokdonella sp. MW10 TaxID=2992926 RepID=UPI003F7D5863
MGRRRKHNRHLPACMFQRRGAYYLVRAGKWHPLGRDFGPALIKYAELIGTAPQVNTVRDAIAHYLETSANRLAPATLEGYRHSAERLASVFGAMRLQDVTAAHVYRYLTEHGTVSANRDRALLSAAYTHARRTGAFPRAADDPTKGLNYRNEEKPRQRYVTDEEQETLLDASSPKLACIQRFLHLTAMRQGDALRVRLDGMDGEGIHYTTEKTGVARVVVWSDELRACVAEANRLWRRFGRLYLFESNPKGKHAKRGPGPYTPSGLRALFRVARAKSGVKDVRLHDLRRKAGSDIEEAHATELLAHKNPATTRKHYRAKPVRTKPSR